MRLVASRRRAPTTASTTSSPTRCCGSSSTTSGTSRNAPDIRRNEVEAFEYGYNVVNEDLARAVIEEIEGQRRAGRDGPRLPPLHAAGARPRARGRTSSCTTSSTSRGRSRTPGACCRRRIRDEIYHGLLANDIIGFHTRSYRRNFLQCCRDLMDLEVDFERGVVRYDGPRGVGARLPAADRRRGDARGRRARRARREFEERAAAPPARAPDPARRPRRPVEERPARLHRASTSSSSSTRSSASGSRSSRS